MIALAHPAADGVSISVVTPFPPPAPADRLAGIIDLLCRSAAAQIAGRRLAGPLIILICSRVRRIAGRLAGIAARLQAGKLRRPAATRRQPARPKRPYRKRPLPQGRAWLMRLVPEAPAAASQLRHLLAEPEMAAFIAAAPQAGRPLRSLCWMLGVRPPPGLKPAQSTPSAAPAPQAAATRPAQARAPLATPPPSPASPPPLHPPACGPPVWA